MAESKTVSQTNTTTEPTMKEKIVEKVQDIKEKLPGGNKDTAESTTTTTTTPHTTSDTIHHDHVEMAEGAGVKGPSKMHAAKEKLVGGIKETIGTIAHAESMKEAGREQKREGDAEALAAGKGKKHYDPALARKGVGIQHKHLGPNPKKLTEGPCAGCKDGTCQIGHEYDAAICHSCTQGHCDAGHVKSAGMPLHNAGLHGDGVVPPVGRGMQISEPFNVVGHCSCAEGGAQPVTGHIHTSTEAPVLARQHQNTATAAPAVSTQNTAYDAATCPYCTKTTQEPGWHSKRDKDMMDKMEAKKFEKDQKLMEKQEEKMKKNKD